MENREELKNRLTISKEEKEKVKDVVVTIKKKDLQMLEAKAERFEKVADELQAELIENEEKIEELEKENEEMKRYISNGIEFGYIDDREKAYEKFTKSK
jgi:predicted RNase H-like nuclease (RuvC/YqgF family)